MAFDLDAAAAIELLGFDNRQAFLRMKSLVRSIEVVMVAVNGGDVKKLIDRHEEDMAREQSRENETDPLDGDNLW